MKREEHNEVQDLKVRFDKHLEIYAANGKELARVATNQEWLMRFFWLLMTPIVASLVYIVMNLK